MGKTKKVNESEFRNPFNGPEREELWARLKQNAKPVSKSELIKRAAELRKQNKK